MSYAIDSKKIATNTIAMYIRLGITMVISFFTARITLQQLGVEDYGLNNLVGSIVSMFSFIVGSMSTAVARYYNIEIGKNNEKMLGRVFGVGMYLHIIVAIITLLLAEIFAIFFLHKLNIPTERLFAAQVVFQISVISLVLNIVNVPYSALLRAREMFSQIAMVEIVQSFLRLGVLFLLIRIGYDKLIALSLLNFGITLMYIAALAFMARRFKETHNKPIRDKELIKQMLSFISMLLVTILASLLTTQGTVILINLFFGLTINAAYAVAVQVSGIVSAFVENFKSPMAPQMTKAYGAGDLTAMHKVINMGTKITFLLMLMISVPVIFESQFLLDIWLKTPPEHSAELVSLVLIAINISSFTYFQYQGVHASGNIFAQQIWMSSTYILNIIVVYVVFKLGASFEAAVYVNMIICAIQCCVNLYYGRKNYNYSIRRFISNVLTPCLVVVVIIMVTMSSITHLLEPSTARFILVFVLSEVLICVGGYYLILDKIEKQRVIQFASDFIKKKKNDVLHL